MDRTKEFLQLVTAAAANKTLISPVKIPLPSTTPETSIDEQFSKLTNEVSNGFDLCKAEFSELDTRKLVSTDITITTFTQSRRNEVYTKRDPQKFKLEHSKSKR